MKTQAQNNRSYYQRNKRKVIAKSTARNRTPEMKEWFKRYRKDPSKWVLLAVQQARARAKKRGLDFNVYAEDIALPAVCPITLRPFNFSRKGGKASPDSPSLDRIDSRFGYVRGNVRVISYLANVVKNNVEDPEIFRRLYYDALGKGIV